MRSVRFGMPKLVLALTTGEKSVCVSRTSSTCQKENYWREGFLMVLRIRHDACLRRGTRAIQPIHLFYKPSMNPSLPPSFVSAEAQGTLRGNKSVKKGGRHSTRRPKFGSDVRRLPVIIVGRFILYTKMQVYIKRRAIRHTCGFHCRDGWTEYHSGCTAAPLLCFVVRECKLKKRRKRRKKIGLRGLHCSWSDMLRNEHLLRVSEGK